MEWSWKKTLGACVAFILLVVLPIFLVSNPMMDDYQRRIDRNPNSDFSRWLQFASANVCYRTLRPERAAEYYRRFLERYREDPRRPLALLRYGQSLEEAGRNSDAIAVYEQFLTEYPDLPERAEAQAGIERIRYIKPIK